MIIKSLFNKYRDYRELQKIRMKWLTVLVYAGVTVGSEEDNTAATFDLLEMKKTETGIEAISLVPYGLSVKQLQESKEKLQDALNSYITIDKNPFKPKIHISITTKEPNFRFEPVKLKENEFFIGLNFKGKPVISNLNITSSYLICGTRGSGKTCSLIIMLTHLMLSNKSIEMYYIQIKKAEMSIFASCQQTKAIAYTVDEAYLLLKYLNEQIDKRAELLKNAKGNVDNLSKYNQKYKEKKLNRIMLIIEEASFFSDITKSDKDYEKAQKCWSLIKQIGKAGRSVGVAEVLISQRSTKDDIDSGAKSQLARITFKQESSTDSINIIGNGQAAKLRAREMLTTLTDANEKLITQTIKEDYSELIEVLPELGAEATKEQLKAQQDFIDSLRPNKTQNLRLKSVQERVIKDIPKIEPVEVVEAPEREVAVDREPPEQKKQLVKTDRDKKLLRFIEANGSLTVKQASALFFKKNKTTESCRKRLTELVAAGYLEVAATDGMKGKQYFFKGQKPKTVHDLYVMNAYIRLVEAKCKILEFKREPHLMDSSIIPDAYIKFKHNNKTYNFFIEVDYTHFTEQLKINLYEQYSNINNQNFCIILARKGKIRVTSDLVDIYQTDFEFSELLEIVENL